jgi:AcrR family transcriptional regulator
MTTKPVVMEKTSARERLLAAAEELFYEEGINTVGIDRVIERAGVAKASLYNLFGSKDELIRAYLTARHEARKERLEKYLPTLATPQARILGIFDDMREMAVRTGFRGCAFVRAAAELRGQHCVKNICDESRGWLRGLFTDLAREAGAKDPAGLARQLVLLYDGAAVSGQMEAAGGGAQAAREAATQLMQANGVSFTAQPAIRAENARDTSVHRA